MKFSVYVTENENPQVFSHSYRASWYYQGFIYSPTDALVSCFKNSIKIDIKTAHVLM